MPDLRVEIDGLEFGADWLDRNPETQAAVDEALPLEGEAARWGDELYFETSVTVEPEETCTEVPVGGVAYWPDGNAVCVFWGETPASREGEPRAAGPVNLFAELQDVGGLEEMDGGAWIQISSP